jgi:hypothetical protein
MRHLLRKLLTLANGGITIEKVALTVNDAGRKCAGTEAANHQVDFFRGKIARPNAVKNTIILIHLHLLSIKKAGC